MDYTPIMSGLKWSHRNITYSFMKSPPAYLQSDTIAMQTFAPVTISMQAEITSILTPAKSGDTLRPAYFSDVSLFTFSLSTSTGDIAIGSHFQPPNAPATGQLPYPYDYGGDIFLGLQFTSPAPKGSHANYTLLHEIGHALGLEHGNVYPPYKLPPKLASSGTAIR